MRWNKFLENIQSDLKLFAFILAVLCLYRISFMFIMNGYMEADSGTSDILLANWAGLRLSLKTAGIVMALSVILGTLPQLIFNKLPQSRISFSKASIPISIIASGVGAFAKSLAVVTFTLLSVHCADNITAISNSKGFLNIRAGFTSLYTSPRISIC